MIVAALLLNCLVAQPALAAPDPAATNAVNVTPGSLDADEDFGAALELYQDLEFEQAIFRLQDAALVTAWADEDRARVFVWMGVNYAQLGDEASARRSFLHAARRDPAIELPVSVSPTVLKWFEQSVLLAQTQAEEQAVEEGRALSDADPSDTIFLGPPADTADSDLPIPALAAGAGAAASAGLSLMALGASGYLLFVTYTQFIAAQEKDRTQREAFELVNGANLALYAGMGATFAAAVAAAGAATLGILAATFLSLE